MSKFIELRFGQGDLGRSLGINDKVPEGEVFVQREIVPIKAIKDAYIVLPERRNIRITFDSCGRICKRTEYYKTEIDCIKRWCMIRKALGFTAKDVIKNPVPLAMDIEELNEKKGEKENG